MIFIVTNRDDYTADFVIVELNKRKIDYFRFNTEDYPQFINSSWKVNSNSLQGFFSSHNRKIPFSEIKSIWFRRPVFPIPDPLIYGIEDRNYIIGECQRALEGIWRTIDCKWVSNPDKIRIAEDKMFQLIIAKDVGFTIYPTLITNIPSEAKDFYNDNFNDIVCKPINRGRIIRNNQTNLIFTNRIKPEHLIQFPNIKFTHQIFQAYIQKQVEIRVTVIGELVFAVEIDSKVRSETQDDWRRVQSNLLPHKKHTLPENIENNCRHIVKKLGLQFGAIDLILTPENVYIFLEINPNGQWAWIQQLCPELPLRESLIDLLIE